MQKLLIFLLGIILTGAQQNSPSRIYTTKFTLSEYPIHESGSWINGKTTGLDWSDVSTTPGHAIGHQQGNEQYTDATALLTGKWKPNQAARATVFIGKTFPGDYPEVELRLRSNILAHVNTGYEIAYSCCGHISSAYLIIVRWNGPVKDFTYLTRLGGPKYGLVNGDVIRADIRGDTITAYLNERQVGQAIDSIYHNGSPGMGFNFDCFSEGACLGNNEGYGFTEFMASDD